MLFGSPEHQSIPTRLKIFFYSALCMTLLASCTTESDANTQVAVNPLKTEAPLTTPTPDMSVVTPASTATATEVPHGAGGESEGAYLETAIGKELVKSWDNYLKYWQTVIPKTFSENPGTYPVPLIDLNAPEDVNYTIPVWEVPGDENYKGYLMTIPFKQLDKYLDDPSNPEALLPPEYKGGDQLLPGTDVFKFVKQVTPGEDSSTKALEAGIEPGAIAGLDETKNIVYYSPIINPVTGQFDIVGGIDAKGEYYSGKEVKDVEGMAIRFYDESNKLEKVVPLELTAEAKPVLDLLCRKIYWVMQNAENVSNNRPYTTFEAFSRAIPSTGIVNGGYSLLLNDQEPETRKNNAIAKVVNDPDIKVDLNKCIINLFPKSRNSDGTNSTAPGMSKAVNLAGMYLMVEPVNGSLVINLEMGMENDKYFVDRKFPFANPQMSDKDIKFQFTRLMALLELDMQSLINMPPSAWRVDGSLIMRNTKSENLEKRFVPYNSSVDGSEVDNKIQSYFK